MRIFEDFDFTAGPDLATTAGTGAAYELTLPASASAEASRIAGIFNVSGSPVDVNSDGQDFTVTDPTGNYVEYETYDTVPQWSYSIAIPQAAGTSSTTSDGTTVAMPSQSTVERRRAELPEPIGLRLPGDRSPVLDLEQRRDLPRSAHGDHE